MRKHVGITLSLLLVLALSLSACGGTSAPKEPASKAPQTAPTSAPAPAPAAKPAKGKGGPLTIGMSQDLQTLNPLAPTLEVSRGVHYAIFDPLWRATPEGDFAPVLAASVPTTQNGGISADGLIYKIKLKTGVKWHDGQPFSAKDAKFTWELIMNPKFRAWSKAGHDKVKEFKVVDDTTIEIKLSEPFAPYIAAWADTYLVPEHILSKEADPNIAKFNTSAPVGTGPFKFGEWKPDNYVMLEANLDYHGDGPYLSKVIYKVIPDLTVLYSQFKAGEVDVVEIQGIAPPFVKEAESLKGRKIYRYASNGYESVYLNQTKPIFADIRVRQALMMATDKKPILDKVYYGLNKESLSYIPPHDAYFNPSLKPLDFDVKKANQLLDQAGWSMGSDGVRVKDGTRLSFDISTTSGNKEREQTEQILQQQWKLIGVDLRIKNMAAATLFGDFYRLSQFDALIVSIPRGADPDYLFRLHSKQVPIKNDSKSGGNYIGYQNPEMDQLLESGVREADPAKRKQIYGRIQEILVNDVPTLPLFHREEIRGTKDTVRGYVPNPNALTNTWNINEWYFAN